VPSESQNRPNKGLIGKFVLRNDLATTQSQAETVKATATVPFLWVDSPGIGDEQLFLTEKLRQDRYSIRQ
jgi:hypothetical protein